MNKASSFISKRLRLKGKLSTICVAVSFFVIVLAMAISGGFRSEIRKGLGTAAGDVRIISTSNSGLAGNDTPLPTDAPYLDKVRELPYVTEIQPVISRAAIVKTDGQIHGIMVKGVEDGHPSCPSGEMGAIIPKSLSDALNIAQDDDMTAYFIGERVQVRKLHVESVYTDALDSRDMCIVYVPISVTRRLNRWEDNQASAFEIMLRDPSEEAINLATGEIGMLTSLYGREEDPSVYATNIMSTYPQLFDWLALVDFNVAIVLLIMTIVAGFNMISGLLIILFENISTIGLLKALGMGNRGIAGVFLRCASNITLKGMAIGNIAALVVCLIQGTTHVLKLNPVNYFVDHVPVALNIGNLLLADAVAYVAIILMMLIPTMFISKVDPAKSLKTN